MTVAVVVLAAGRGQRLGQPKAFVRIGGQTFLERVLATAREAGLTRLIAVLGPEAPAPVPADVVLARNPDVEAGPIASLRAGLAAAGDARAALAWPVDHPLVRAATVRQILDTADGHPGRAVVPTFRGRGGHPTLFPRELFAALATVPAEEGARGVPFSKAATSPGRGRA
jgi:CTP:molybdopterin cytidylyltransferase MocA